MRFLDQIILHCSATPETQDVDVKDLDRWHREQGWDGCGYHYVIKLDGTIQWGRPVERQGAHCRGHNATSIGICLVGGLSSATGQPADTFTAAQRTSLLHLLLALKRFVPNATLHAHNEFAAKACPCFDIRPFRELWAE